MDTFQVIRAPHITEKAGLQKEAANQISFKVHPRAKKIEIREAVEAFFKTKVEKVRIINVRGKRRRLGRNVGRRADWKKAIVRLAPGESIEFFEGI